ncbi:SPOR domain-containing protein [Massilia aerilata]|uniref:SPOR domain-containing protein n=1 Tax=Massilia aerilata TaxID=453817 RepID=A0ABW0RU46_9BURK
MGLFSFFGKNKQGRAAEDSGRFYSKDDDAALGERARSKRASSAGAVAGSTRGRGTGNDPLLPEKKRARRRLVGAIALALAAAVGLPMLLDSQPKPLAGDIAIQIPAKDKAAPLPVPAEPSSPPATAPAPVSAADASRGVKAVAAADSVDKGEEVLQDVPPVKAAPKPERKPEPPKAKAEPKPEPKPEHKPEHKPASQAEHKLADKSDKADKADKPVKPKSEDKPARPHDESRALAILEGKAADKPDKPADTGSQKVVLQVAAMSSQEKAAELQARLHGAGINSYTQKSGELVKVKIGPLSKEEAEKVRAKLGRIGLSGFQTPA